MQKTTYLEAVNTILRVLGEQPVSSISDPLPPSATAAVANLNEVSREVQSRGWHFNTEYDYPLLRNGSNQIPVPVDVVRVDVPGKDYVQRGELLYDLENNTLEFDDDVEAEIVRLLEWEDLPEAARAYIMIRAARKTQDRYNQGADTNIYSARDEAEALTDLKQAHSDTGDYNIFQNLGAFQIINRERPWVG